MSLLIDLRDYVYTAIRTKQTANGFYTFNDFVTVKTWRPWETIEKLADANSFPNGKLYVIAGRPGDMITQSRGNMVLRDYPVHVGFQRYITKLFDPNDPNYTTEVDIDVAFVEELEETLRTEIDNSFSQNSNLFPMAFNRLEPMRDPDGVPLSFILASQANLFEAYFTAFFSRPLAENVATTTT